MKFSRHSRWSAILALTLAFGGMNVPLRAQQSPTNGSSQRNASVEVRFDVNPQGQPINLELAESTGNEAFDTAILEAVSTMRLGPSEEERTGISATIQIEFEGLSTYAYPPEIVQAFVDGCMQDEGTSQAFCTCAIEEAQQNYPFEEFLEVSLQWSQGGVGSEKSQQILGQIIGDCASELPFEEFQPQPQ
ncbi:MAG: energy transducer TonB [Cyanobacteriota bacterium]|nr:energy transducer TonB [Cyanobacteriota bacterium]